MEYNPFYKIDPSDVDSVLAGQIQEWEEERRLLMNKKENLEAKIAALGRQIDAVTKALKA